MTASLAPQSMKKQRKTADRTFRSTATRSVDTIQRGIRTLSRSLASRKNNPTAEERASVQAAWEELKTMGDQAFEVRPREDKQILTWR